MTMDVIRHLSSPGRGAIECVETHTVGMPCRILFKGYPNLTGTLASQKAEAARTHDHIRKLVILEPRGHSGMFGAILRPHTELTDSGEAHMGLLYMHAGGYSNMCGHATVAVSRFLIDTQDLDVFPRRGSVEFDPVARSCRLVLHTPAGLVETTVPTTPDGSRSDPSRPVSFVAVPAYALATDLNVVIPEEFAWPELGSRTSVNLSLAYCGAFACQVRLEKLGFPGDSLQSDVPLDRLKHAATQLKAVLNTPRYEKLIRHPENGAAGSIYGVMIVAEGQGIRMEGTKGVDTGLYVFADGVFDRSPTGSMAAARNAVAFARGDLDQGESWSYHCLVSNTVGKGQGFSAKVIEGQGRRSVEEGGQACGPVVVSVEGFAYYTGYHTFVLENEDPLGRSGFSFENL